MPILTERKTWARPRDTETTRRSSDLTPTEQANVRVAIRFLRIRLGSMGKLAAATATKAATLDHALRGNVTAGVALRVARVAGVQIEDVLTGRFPPSGVCPHCGRGDPTPRDALCP